MLEEDLEVGELVNIMYDFVYRVSTTTTFLFSLFIECSNKFLIRYLRDLH
jgi:hypothetical protein